MNKRDLRKNIMEQNLLHSAEEMEEMSCTTCEKIIGHEKVKAADTIVLFWSMEGEIDTHRLVEKLIKTKNVILITQSARTPPVMPPDDAVIIVPAVAYDTSGHRLGRGKGYYDRYLANLSGNYKIGVCFPWQVVENIPVERHDVCVDEIIL